jgi:putative protein kinase ArgK-like GTPase of G3E family
MGAFIDSIIDFNKLMVENHKLGEKRAKQSEYWMWAQFQKLIIASLERNPILQKKTAQLKKELRHETTAPRLAAAVLYDTFAKNGKE